MNELMKTRDVVTDLMNDFSYLTVFHNRLMQARTYQRTIPAIAHQRMSPVSAPPMFSANRLSALYADAMEPILIQVVPRYNPSSYLDDVFTSSMQVS